jgi:tyrosine-protein kinase Etk/Wzc
VDLTLETESKLTRLVELETRLNELSIKENELQQRYTRQHPSYQTLIEQRRSLQSEKQKLETEIESLPETQQEILRLRRDMEVNQEIYMQLRNKAQELRVLKAGTVASVRIVDEALTSPRAVKPRKPLILALSLVLGGMLGVGYVLARAFLNRTVQSPEALEEAGMSVYASLPVSQRQLILDQDNKARRTNALPLLAREAPTDLTVEALRGLRTSLHFAMMDATSNVLMLSGPSPGVGKSFISANLGTVLAQAEQSVIVVDADLRKGHLHRYFDAESGPGLSDYLAGKASLEDVVTESGIPGLRFIPRGEVPPNPAELLMHKRMKHLVDELAAQFDRVIIDTPPILAVTDPAIVGQYAGASMLVVRYGQNHLKEIEVAEKRFRQNGIELKGAILNAIEHSRAHVYGYYPYKYPSRGEGA